MIKQKMKKRKKKNNNKKKCKEEIFNKLEKTTTITENIVFIMTFLSYISSD